MKQLMICLFFTLACIASAKADMAKYYGYAFVAARHCDFLRTARLDRLQDKALAQPESRFPYQRLFAEGEAEFEIEMRTDGLKKACKRAYSDFGPNGEFYPGALRRP